MKSLWWGFAKFERLKQLNVEMEREDVCGDIPVYPYGSSPPEVCLYKEYVSIYMLFVWWCCVKGSYRF